MSKINNLHLIDDIDCIQKYFDENSDDVDNTKELNNVVLTYQECKKPKTELPTKTDEEERDWLYKEIDFAIKKIRKDKYTRQAIIYNTHNSGLDHNCLNVFHFYYRQNVLNLNVYVRSMNFDKNFENDLYTFNILLNKACNELMLDKGQIVVFVMSLHRFKK